MTAKIPYEPSGYAKAQALVINKKGKQRITRPVLMVEGFPFNYEWGTSFNYANQNNFSLDLINNQDYDVILVRFPVRFPGDGPLHVQAYAYALIEIIRQIIGLREGTEKLIIGGFSMGGLIARFALAFMEHHRSGNPAFPHHQTAKLFTVDTPHEGANVSIAVQALAQLELKDSKQAEQMRSPAAQQMLLAWVHPLPWTRVQQFGPSSERLGLIRQLREIGWRPREVQIIAIADGGGDGKAEVPGGTLVLDYSCFSYALLYFCSAASGQLVLRVYTRGSTYYEVKTGAASAAYDSAPGGVWEVPIFKKAYDEIPLRENAKTLHVKSGNGCFVPTTSALGIPGKNYFEPPRLSDSPFDKLTYHQPKAGEPRNETHVKLTPQLIAFLRNQVFGLTAGTAESTA